MAATASMRWGAFRSIGMAVRAATRSGSPGLGERLRAVPRLVRSTVRGDYRGTSRGQLALLLGAVLYVVSPMDLVPEAALRAVGLGDDAMVIAWIATALVNQTEGYLAWERQRAETVHGRRHLLTLAGSRPSTAPWRLVPPSTGGPAVEHGRPSAGGTVGP